MARRPLIIATLIAAISLAAVPHDVSGARLVNVASMLLKTSYVLKAHLNYSYGTVSATETISIRNVSGRTISKLNLSVMPRAFGELESIGTFRVDGVATTAAWTNNANLELQLGKNLANGATTKVSLRFKVRANSIIRTSLQGRLSKVNGIMQVAHWFPIISSGHGMRYPGDSQFTRAATRIRLDLTTESSSVRIAAPGRVLYSSGVHHIYELSNARDFAFGASPSYRKVSGSAAGVAIHAYSTSGDGAAAVASAKSALARFEAAFGEYQWTRFVIAQTGRGSSGNEYPGIIFLGGGLFSVRSVVAHETAHQWWYAMVGNEQIREPWIDEGLAEFTANYFYGSFRTYASTLPINTPSTFFPNLPSPTTANDPDSYAQTIYHKSARFIEGLRIRMGTAAFFEALRGLVRTNRNGVLTTREFYDAMVGHGASRAYLDSFIRL